MSNKYSIFLVEDDLNFGTVMKSYLELNDFNVSWIDDGKDAVSEFKKRHYDLCLLDVMLPHVDGFTIARQIQITSPNTPIIFLTAKALKNDIMEGFNLGADDYITKPFDSEILLLKIKAILKRNSAGAKQVSLEKIDLGNYFFNYKTRTLTINNITQHLSPKEAELLKMLYEYKNKILSREIALKAIWENDNYFTARSMDVYITKLRKHLKEDSNLEIENIHGSGFILHVRGDGEMKNEE